MSLVNPIALKLLLVEDDTDTRDVFRQLLERRGFEVLCAASVKQALDFARGHHIDVLVADLGLPDGDGCDVMRGIAQQRPVAGIAVSGYGMPADLERTRAAGFASHLVKPVTIGLLVESIENAMEILLPSSPID